jgi:hypothetical protein
MSNQRHYNPMQSRNRDSDGETSTPNDGYDSHLLTVTEIRDKSVGIQINPMSVQFMGRSLLHAASDDRLSKYRGPLPIEMRLTVRTWWLQRYGFLRE